MPGEILHPIRKLAWFAVALGAAVSAGCAGDPGPAAGAPAGEILVPEPGLIRVAGSGAMNALGVRLASAWPAAPGLRVEVAPSIGSGAAVRAVADGAVDLGMISRPLNDAEQKLGLEVFPVARDVVVVAANEGVPVSGISRRELVELFTGARDHWPDGSRTVPLFRDRQESANIFIEGAFPELRAAREAAYGQGRRVLYYDDAMLAALLTTPGAVGVAGLGSIRCGHLPLKALAVDGQEPSASPTGETRWPAIRPLAFIARPERVARVRPFLDFATSPASRAVILDCGYLPLSSAP